ncbi:MAG: histidinol-phosphatase, partial [Proteobacteria bacterium]
MRKLLFIDRDGTLLDEPEDYQIDSLAKVSFVKNAIPSLLLLKAKGYRFILVSNQDGLGTTSFPASDFEPAQKLLMDTLKSCGLEFDDILICPHFAQDKCACRKPSTGLLKSYIREGFDYENSAVIGDRDTDLELAERLGVRGFKLSPETQWRDIVAALGQPSRKAVRVRKTKETSITVKLDLDTFSPPRISTGLRYLDHLLEQIAYHASFDIEIDAKGDLDVDDHHTIEDIALAFGEALRQALGDKWGIGRFGFTLPMDECRAECLLDLSGRPYSLYEAKYSRDKVG